MGDLEPQAPFTLVENIDLLNTIDKLVVQLMLHTSTALGTLTTSAPSTAEPASKDNSDPDLELRSQKDAFVSATDSFLITLHSIDVRMKRQISALEEAGIIQLSTPPRQRSGAISKASLKPNGFGSIGNLDMGWLNSRSTRVEREVEAELWQNARSYLDSEGQKIKPPLL